MGPAQAPMWLFSSYCRTMRALGSPLPKEELTLFWQSLVTRLTDPSRFFHNLKHVQDVLTAIDTLAESTRHPEHVRAAAWYHGARMSSNIESIYKGFGGEDPIGSADYCAIELSAMGIDLATIAEVCDLIRPLVRHSSSEGDIDAQVLSDADLWILSAEPQKFKEYRDQVRLEYAHLPIGDYIRARLDILGSLLKRKRIFVSPLTTSWESNARENLQAEIERLATELEKLESEGKLDFIPASADPELAAILMGHPVGDTPVSSQIPKSSEATASVASQGARIPSSDIEAPSAAVTSAEDARSESEDPEEKHRNRDPYADASSADLASSMEACEDLLDTLATTKASRPPSVPGAKNQLQ
ncbi:MAG: hypothetical protein Q4G30_06625 [Actinomycetaceae bacterium]|nr:hypothetical protein [Actinomycetaceae bacterium]